MSDELQELQKEWRQHVSTSLGELRLQNDNIIKQLSEIRTKFITQESHDELARRVSQLESDRAKVIGGVVVLQVIGGAVIWVVSRIKSNS